MKRFAAAKDLILSNLVDIVPQLFGGGIKQTRLRQRDGSWQVANKWRSGADLSEMKIWPGGAWKDFVSGDAGDAIDLVAFGLVGHVSKDTRLEAVAWVEDRYGVRTMAPEARQKLQRDAAARRLTMDEEAAKATAEAHDKARKSFYAAQPEIFTTAPGRYARGRGVDLAAIPNLATNSFRFRPDCDYWPSREFLTKAAQFPGMLSAMVDGAGRLGAVHYTFFEPGGDRKLDTLSRGWVDEKPDGRKKGKSAKLMFPDTAGLVVRVTRGPSGLTCEQAASQGISGWWLVTEGIEDGWSFGLSDPELRVHAAGSLSGYLHIPDHPAAKGYLLGRDNDWDKPQAVSLFDRAFARLKSFGKPVEAVAMPTELGKDANDVLNWKG